MKRRRPNEPKPYAVDSTLLRETPDGAWYRVTMSDGRVLIMSVPYERREEN